MAGSHLYHPTNADAYCARLVPERDPCRLVPEHNPRLAASEAAYSTQYDG